MNSSPLDVDLKGKRAIVTGASRGIGQAAAAALVTAGARVALVSRRAEGLAEAARAIDPQGTNTMTVVANMNREEDVEAIVPAVVQAWGGVDILVNNAATNPVFGPMTELETGAWDKILDTNVRGPFLLSRAAARAMKENGEGSIVNVASVAALEPAPNLGAYSISKAAILSMTKVFAAELGSSGIRVNCVAPGLVETKFAEVLINTPEIHEAIVSHTPLGRHGQPDEIAAAILFLAAPTSSFMTGQVMVVDGGSRL